MTPETLRIDESVVIPLDELSFRYARSSGPGGQHVQRTETKVELLFDVAHTPSLSEEQRRLVIDRLGTRVDSEGVLHLSSQASRSQLENREEVMTRFQRLLAWALRPRPVRKATRPSPAARQKRLEAKRRRGEIKRLRRRAAALE